MKSSKFKKISNLLITVSISILVVFLLLFFVSPAYSILKTQNFAVFNEVWQTVNDNFYDSNFNGVNWKTTRQKYEIQVKQAKSIDEASVVINQMLSELKTSHTHFYTKSEPAYYQLLGIFNAGSWNKIKKFFPSGKLDYTGIGVFTKDIDSRTFITAVLDGSPAESAGLNVGDQVLATNGNEYRPIQSFVDKADRKVELSIQQTPDPKITKKITVIPKILDPNTMFLDAMRSSIEIIKRNEEKIGYVHIWSYAGEQYQQLLEEEIAFGKLKEADGLILDLRDGWGGADPNYLNIFTEKVPVMTQIGRDGIRKTLDFQWRKPVVMVVNNGSRSGKEILAYGFKQYKLGTVIGTKTAGAVVGGRPFLMQDGSLLYLAVVDVFINGERLEGKGVTPDIEVPFQLEYAQGKDPQKERAIEVLVKSLAT